MKRLALLAAMAVCAVLVRSARASDVLDVSDIVTFEGQDNAGAANVNIRQYSSLVPTGGGEFVIGAGDCTSDHGVVLKDNNGSGNCYYRQFSGPVYLKWYGVTSMADSGAPDVTTQLKYAIAIAAAVNPVPNANAASGVVDTDGMRIHVSDNGNTTGHAIDILKDVRLTCDAPPGGTRKMMRTPDYTATPATIVLIPNGTSPVGSIFPADNAGFDHCIVLTTGSSAYPIVLNPASTAQAMQDVRYMIANAGTAVDCYNIASCNVHDNLIIGFDTAIEVNMSSHAKIDNDTVDADVGIFLTTLGSSAVINGFEMDSQGARRRKGSI
jgi:hypothetical protein